MRKALIVSVYWMRWSVREAKRQIGASYLRLNQDVAEYGWTRFVRAKAREKKQEKVAA